ncbi:unnamed protein product [Amoebophrya sp. A120]|nr:unnamed protein product [Amoebophrya sp. A120]|eukprot:GSA120T00022021001.1
MKNGGGCRTVATTSATKSKSTSCTDLLPPLLCKLLDAGYKKFEVEVPVGNLIFTTHDEAREESSADERFLEDEVDEAASEEVKLREGCKKSTTRTSTAVIPASFDAGRGTISGGSTKAPLVAGKINTKSGISVQASIALEAAASKDKAANTAASSLAPPCPPAVPKAKGKWTSFKSTGINTGDIGRIDNGSDSSEVDLNAFYNPKFSATLPYSRIKKKSPFGHKKKEEQEALTATKNTGKAPDTFVRRSVSKRRKKKKKAARRHNKSNSRDRSGARSSRSPSRRRRRSRDDSRSRGRKRDRRSLSGSRRDRNNGRSMSGPFASKSRRRSSARGTTPRSAGGKKDRRSRSRSRRGRGRGSRRDSSARSAGRRGNRSGGSRKSRSRRRASRSRSGSGRRGRKTSRGRARSNYRKRSTSRSRSQEGGYFSTSRGRKRSCGSASRSRNRSAGSRNGGSRPRRNKNRDRSASSRSGGGSRRRRRSSVRISLRKNQSRSVSRGGSRRSRSPRDRGVKRDRSSGTTPGGQVKINKTQATKTTTNENEDKNDLNSPAPPAEDGAEENADDRRNDNRSRSRSTARRKRSRRRRRRNEDRKDSPTDEVEQEDNSRSPQEPRRRARDRRKRRRRNRRESGVDEGDGVEGGSGSNKDSQSRHKSLKSCKNEKPPGADDTNQVLDPALHGKVEQESAAVDHAEIDKNQLRNEQHPEMRSDDVGSCLRGLLAPTLLADAAGHVGRGQEDIKREGGTEEKTLSLSRKSEKANKQAAKTSTPESVGAFGEESPPVSDEAGAPESLRSSERILSRGVGTTASSPSDSHIHGTATCHSRQGIAHHQQEQHQELHQFQHQPQPATPRGEFLEQQSHVQQQFFFQQPPVDPQLSVEEQEEQIRAQAMHLFQQEPKTLEEQQQITAYVDRLYLAAQQVRERNPFSTSSATQPHEVLEHVAVDPHSTPAAAQHVVAQHQQHNPYAATPVGGAGRVALQAGSHQHMQQAVLSQQQHSQQQQMLYSSERQLHTTQQAQQDQQALRVQQHQQERQYSDCGQTVVLTSGTMTPGAAKSSVLHTPMNAAGHNFQVAEARPTTAAHQELQASTSTTLSSSSSSAAAVGHANGGAPPGVATPAPGGAVTTQQQQQQQQQQPQQQATSNKVQPPIPADVPSITAQGLIHLHLIKLGKKRSVTFSLAHKVSDLCQRYLPAQDYHTCFEIDHNHPDNKVSLMHYGIRVLQLTRKDTRTLAQLLLIGMNLSGANPNQVAFPTQLTLEVRELGIPVCLHHADGRVSNTMYSASTTIKAILAGLAGKCIAKNPSTGFEFSDTLTVGEAVREQKLDKVYMNIEQDAWA